MVEVIYFPKKCPHCGEILFPVRKLYARWMECRNQNCSFLKTQKPHTTTIKGIEIESEPFPYTYAYTSSA